MSSATPQYRTDIDGLRAVAVLAVVLFHAFPQYLGGGFIGVDVFFVISGFLISTILFTKIESQTFSFFDFYWRRIKRIFPALLLVLISVFIFGWFYLLPDELKLLGRHIASGATFTSNFTLWNESGYFDTASEKKPLLHLWSLAIEEQFYIVWPLVLYFGYKKRINPLKLCLLVFTSSLLFSLIIQSYYPEMNFYSPASRFWEISIGSILAYITLYPSSISSNRLAGALNFSKSGLGITLIFGGLLVLDKTKVFPGAWALLPTLGACLIISAGPNSFINKIFLSNPLMTWVGAISYPLYLWHWPLLAFAHVLLGDTLKSTTTWLLVIASFILAWLTYKIVETPIRHQIYRRSVFITLCSIMFVLWGVGRITYKNEGFISRLPEPIRKYAKIEFDWNKSVRHGSCHIQDFASSEHPAFCIESKRPLIALWGDSHASSLYPGLKFLQENKDFGIIQLTKAGCPPLLGYHGSKATGCYKANSNTLNTLLKAQPDILILHAYWPHIDALNIDQVLEAVSKTAHDLKLQLPHTKIYVLGPVPTWKDSLQKSMINYYLNHKPQEMPPQFMSYGLSPLPKEVDLKMKERLNTADVQYISAYQILCKAEGCLTSIGPQPTDLTAMDYGHLSNAGSRYLIEHVYKDLQN